MLVLTVFYVCFGLISYMHASQGGKGVMHDVWFKQMIAHDMWKQLKSGRDPWIASPVWCVICIFSGPWFMIPAEIFMKNKNKFCTHLLVTVKKSSPKNLLGVCRAFVSLLLAVCRPPVGRLSADSRPTVDRQFQSAVPVDQQTADSQPTVGDLSVKCR